MITTRGASTTHQKYLDALRAKHAVLEDKIKEEQRSPATSSTTIRALKVQKLRLKEEIEGARNTV